MPNKWDKIAAEATEATKAKFKNEISSVTRLNDADVLNIIDSTGISQKDLAVLFKEVKDSTKSNEAKARAIGKIDRGIAALVQIASRLL